MTRPYIRKTAPQRHVNACTDCDGLGVWSEDDWDGEDSQVRRERCETCDGCGLMSDCRQCDEPTALTILQHANGMCGSCAAGLEVAS